MSGPAMFDANVLVYADDRAAGAKAARAREVIAAFAESGLAAVTPQVLGQYWIVATRKLREPLPPEEAELRVRMYLNTMRLFPCDAVVVLEAMRGAQRHGLYYYDAQVWAAALCGGVDTVISEDFSSGSVLEGVRFVNPFAPDFDLDTILAD